MTKSKVSTFSDKLLKGISFRFHHCFCFFLSWMIAAFSWPDQFFLFPLLTSVLAYGLFFFSIHACQKRLRRFFLGSFWFFAVQLVQLGWLATPYYHGFDIYYAYIALALWMGVQFGFLTIVVKPGHRIGHLSIWAGASFWFFIELGRLFVFCGFPFNPVGGCLTYSVVPMQLASALGILGLSFLVILTNLYVYKFLIERKGSRLIPVVILATLPYLFGYWHMKDHQKALERSESVSALLVQTGLYAEEKTEFYDRKEWFIPPLSQWERIVVEIEKKKATGPKLIILPESAVPNEAFDNCYLLEDVERVFTRVWGKIPESTLPEMAFPVAKVDHEGLIWVSNAFIAQSIANHYDTEVVAGMLSSNSKKQESYNSAVHFTPKKAFFQVYKKRVLVPLSEYLPLSFVRSFVAKHGIEYFFTPGESASLFFGKSVMAPSICYEECFSHLVREGRINGANLFINMTNDVWFPHSRLAKDHFLLGRLRAVENGAPLLRACNTGITAGIDSLGRIVKQLPESVDGNHFYRGVLSLDLPLYHHDTLFMQLGNLPMMIAGTFFISLFVLFRKKYRL